MIFFLLYFVLFLVVILSVNWLAKNNYLNKPFARKLTHTTTGVIVCTFPFLLKPWHIIVLSGIFVILMIISKLKKILILNNVERVTWGEVYFPIGVGICAMICLPQNINAYLVGILCLTFADTMANIVGNIKPLKLIKLGSQSKSLGGFIACVVMAFMIFTLFHPVTGNSFLMILGISFFIGFIEFISICGTDNITVPVTASLLSVWLSGV